VNYSTRLCSSPTSWSQEVANGDRCADPRLGEQLVSAVDEFRARLATHLSDEESAVVPVIGDHLNPREWRRSLACGGRFLFRHPKLGLVLAGLVLAGLSEQDKQRFLANVPPPQRIAFRLFGGRVFQNYRHELYGSPST
jgi:hypothetical protein